MCRPLGMRVACVASCLVRLCQLLGSRAELASASQRQQEPSGPDLSIAPRRTSAPCRARLRRLPELHLAPGDVNLTFKRYVESPVRLEIIDDYITSVDGDGLDAELFRSYIAAWGEREAYAVSHVGWGMNPRARWEAPSPGARPPA